MYKETQVICILIKYSLERTGVFLVQVEDEVKVLFESILVESCRYDELVWHHNDRSSMQDKVI